MTQKREEEREAKREAKREEKREEREARREAAREERGRESFADAGPPFDVGEPPAAAGVGARRADEAPVERGDDVLQEQPSAEPKDLTTGEAGDWTTPPPGQPAPADRPVKGLPPEVTDPQKVPRVVNPNFRAGEGYQRFKIRADIPGENSRTLYVLAKKGDKEGAERCYLQACGYDKKKKVLTEQGDIKEVVRPVDLSVRELPD